MDYFSTTNPSSSGSSSVPNKGKEKKKCGKRGNSNGVKLSTDPQSVAARERRHRISDRFKILQSLVPGGSKMDTVSMLEEAINYVKFLKTQILLHQTIMNFMDDDPYLYLPAGSLPPQQPSYFDANFADGVLQPPTSLSFPDGFFQGDDEVQHRDPFDKN
ncbi:transcription factor bHLH140 [Manihot esculenta]|uniref:BHLH domain-containing protein n=1 Tax=Manihot esculenta TaxID=3983 RepID=A0A2C9VGE9_MANES|nr:transcription factor bHLH140 [Manihot esculenta]OAY43749.1 hypothetical protein MANES_08G094800v8 [Manihot esculenta]